MKKLRHRDVIILQLLNQLVSWLLKVYAKDYISHTLKWYLIPFQLDSSKVYSFSHLKIQKAWYGT